MKAETSAAVEKKIATPANKSTVSKTTNKPETATKKEATPAVSTKKITATPAAKSDDNDDVSVMCFEFITSITSDT